MITVVTSILAGAAIILVVGAAAFVLGMRTKSPLVLRPIVALSRSVLNPRQLPRAGRPGSFASIIRHVGRRTGRAYETPVGVIADGGTFLIVLVYGPRTQWLQNVLAAGSATLVTEGRTWRVNRPEIIPIRSVAARLSTADRRMMRLLATTECLRLHPAHEVDNVAPTDVAAA